MKLGKLKLLAPARTSEMPFPSDFDPGRCVLFLGSGFSAGANNSNGENPPIGNGLKQKILQELNIPDSDRDLKDVAGYASRKIDLYSLLRQQYTITELSQEQLDVLQKKWRRIYTTNYDDTVELHGKITKRHPSRNTYSIENARPTKLPPDSVIHLHGYIHACTSDGVLNQLVLDHRSYAEQAALESPWWDQFQRDLRAAEWVFFIGYSLSDFAVAKYLTKRESLAGKTCFVLRGPIDEFTSDRLRGYGSVYDFGVAGFAERCKSAKVGVPIRDFSQLQSFRLMDPYKDNKSVRRPTPVEIEAFLVFGSYDFHSLASTYPVPEYSIPRMEKITEAADKLADARTLLLHSRTANGKSVFADMLSLELFSRGITGVRYRSRSSITPQELDFLREIEKLVIFIPTYDDAIEISDELKGLGERAKFVVEVNTGTEQIRRTETQTYLAKPILRLDLNVLSDGDRRDFTGLLDQAGIPATSIVSQGRAELRDYLIKVVRSSHVRERLSKAIAPLLKDRDAVRVMAATSVLKAFGIHAGTDYIRAVTGADPYDAVTGNELIASEFGVIDKEELAFHSAVFGEYFLQEFVGGEGTASVICRLAFEAARRKNDLDAKTSQRSREARRALGSLMQYGNIQPIFAGMSGAEGYIKSIYETLRDNIIINKEPLFWLQYSIFMQDKDNYGLARKHLEMAYNRASDLDGFLTYQLDTNYLKLILQAPQGEDDFPGDTEVLFELISKVRNMIVAEDHRVHAFKVLQDFGGFCRNHGQKLTQGERSRLSILLLGIINELEELPLGAKTEFGTELIKRKVQEAAGILAGLGD